MSRQMNQANSEDGMWISVRAWECYQGLTKSLHEAVDLAKNNLLRGLLGGFGVGFMTGSLFVLWMLEVSS